MDEKKRLFLLRISVLLLSAALILTIAIPIAKVFNASYSVIIKDTEMNYFRAEKLFICGNTIICKRDSESAKEKSSLPVVEKSRYSFKILSMQDIISIEVIQDEDDESLTDSLPVNPEYLGRFKIRLQGHEGVLVLGVSKERLYGSVKFPGWGKGAVEYLKVVRISGGKVRFTRSASTAKEIRRLGANYLFKHKFTGSYSSSGKVIKGIMLNNRGERHEWEAVKR